MFRRVFITFLVTCLFPAALRAQTPTFQDCLGAIPVCLGTYSTSNIITGTGAIPNEINAVNSCLLTGERNDSWYIITVNSNGNLNFTVIPNNPAHNYDWAIYNLTSSVCSDIFSNPALEVSCNYSNLPGNTGANGLAGAQNNPVIPVSSGQTYVINVSGFSSINQSGYTLDLTASTANITDNTPPVITGTSSMNCGATSVTVSFSERVLCSSVQASDFTITGPGGPYSITGISSTSCIAGASYARDYTLTISPAIATSGMFSLSLVNPVTDLCSNTAVVPQVFPFSISGLTINFNTVDVTCFGGNNGSATTVIGGPPGPYTYQWSPSGGSGPSAQWLTAGTYTVTVTTTQGCSAQASVTINQPLNGLTASVTTTPANGCAANGSATVNVLNGQPPFTFSWWPSGGNAATASNLTAGSYMVTISDANQCVLNYFLTIPSIAGPTVNISNFSNVSCFGGNDGSATVSVAGAPGPFQYQWSPSGGNAQTATGLTAGNYTASVIIAPGCTLTATVSISEPPTALSVNVNSSSTSCGINNGSIIVNSSGGTGTYSYQWTPSITTGSSASNLSAGTYTVTVSDGNGCSETHTANIASSTQPILATTNYNDVSCFGLSDGSTGISINGGTPPLSIAWSGGQTTALLNNLPAGTYSVTVTDALGCSATISSIINEPPLLNLNQQNITHVNCFGDNTGSITFIANGGTGSYNWQWQGSTSTSSTAGNLAAGNYTAVVTDANGCSASQQVTIQQPLSPLTIQGTTVETTCGNNDGSISTSVSGGTVPYSYQWSNGASSQGIGNLLSGIYTLTITDQKGCIDSAMFTIQSSDAPVISIVSVSNVLCAGNNEGSATLSVTGGQSPYTWAWQGNVSTGNSATGLAAGSYNITVTDAAGCSSFQQVVITQPDSLSVQLSPAVTICINGNTTLQATVTGGTQPYLYSWSTGSNSASSIVTPVSSTSYTVTVTDNNGCTFIPGPVVVTVLPPLSVSVTAPGSVCSGDGASIVLQATGGDGNYSFLWNNGLSGASNSLVITGDTTIQVTLNDGCTTPSASATISISALIPPSVSFTIPSQSGCAPFDALFSVPQGLPSGFIYQWDFGDGYTSSLDSVMHTYLSDGLYNVSLSVAYAAAPSCATQLDFQQAVDVKPVPVARFIYEPSNPTRNHPDVYFTDRSTNAIEWLWTFGDNTPGVREQNVHHVYADTGTYMVSLTAESPDGCLDSTTQEVEVKDDFQVYIPNAFTPNASGTNDYFKIYGVGFVTYELYIFDRWGKMVHYAKNNESAWDGTFDESGLPVPEGLYVYKVTLTDNAGNTHDRFNHVTVIR